MLATELKARADYLATQPVARPLLVTGSVGPYGAYLADGSEYRGDYHLPHEKMLAFHRPRVTALVAVGGRMADWLLLSHHASGYRCYCRRLSTSITG